MKPADGGGRDGNPLGAVTLYSYWRSSSAWRVRWALAQKGIPFQLETVDLRAGTQRAAAHQARNPMAQVPTLRVAREDSVVTLSQSVAICLTLEALWPSPPLLPSDPWQRGRVLELMEIINAGIQPMQNMAVLERVETLGGDASEWARHFIETGLAAFLARLPSGGLGDFSVGDQLSLADVFLVPQLYNARRYGVNLASFGRLTAIEQACTSLPSYQSAHPTQQPDAPGPP